MACFSPPRQFSFTHLLELRRLTGSELVWIWQTFALGIILISNFDVCDCRCFVNGCDDPDDPVYKADWINETIFNNIKKHPRDWRCVYQDFDIIPNADTPSCATNYTANKTCDAWVFDDSVFTKTIVIDVSHFLLINFNDCLIWTIMWKIVCATQYTLVCQESWKVTFGSFITMLGILLGAFFLGPLPDL